jgi:uncharacterized protein YjcR
MAIEEAFIMQRARQLYWQGYPPAEIARLMGINQNTIYSWKKRDEWDSTPPIQRVTTSIDCTADSAHRQRQKDRRRLQGN